MNNLIKEDLIRFKLLSDYDNKKTLTENNDLVSSKLNIILENQFLKNFLRGGRSEVAVAKEIDNIFSSVKGGVMNTKGLPLTKGDDIVRAIKAGELSLVELGKVHTALFRSTTDDALKLAIARDMASTKSFEKTMLSAADDAEAIAKLMGPPKKFTQEEAQLLVKEYRKLGKTIRWEQFKDKIKGMTRSNIFKTLIAAGGVYLAWQWWKDKGSEPFPDCIGKSLPKKDFDKMANEGDGSVMVNTGISTIDRAGGGKFYDNKKFLTGNGKYSGTWNEVSGVGIVITIGNSQYTMSCTNSETNPEPKPEPKPEEKKKGGGTSWIDCSGTYYRGCKSNVIAKVQGCLGGLVPDGKFGPKTEAALKAKNFMNGFKDADVSIICSETNPVEPTIVEPTIDEPTDDDVVNMETGW